MVVIFILCTAPQATATISRVSSLGGGGDFFEDDSNVLRWYGSLGDYPDQVVVESGNFTILDGYWHSSRHRFSGPGAGVHKALGQGARFGTAAFYYHGQDEDRTTAIQRDHLRGNLSFLYALDLGGVSAAVTYRHGSLITEIYDSTTELSIDTFGTGVRVDLGPAAYLDLAGEIRRVHEDRSWDPDFVEISNNGLLAFRARAFVGLGPRMALVPLVEIIDEDRQAGFQERRTHNHNLWRLGLGWNYFPNTDHLLLFSAEYSDFNNDFNSSNTTISENLSTLIIKIGFESRMLSWLTTRGSLGFVNHNMEYELNSAPYQSVDWEYEDPVLRVNLGASIHFGPLDLDFAFWEKPPETHFMPTDPASSDRWNSITARLLF